jgi:hypothetical protein
MWSDFTGLAGALHCGCAAIAERDLLLPRLMAEC